ncbi:ATP-binding protein [Uliginosibacterium sp. 31-16]|uniref:sensor histidine kinase n=1 Tax=Uliginosibacterium sp. 31-16 TaxID=3068315 RepID=UPI00273E8863|nr:ATP-binding protein [Uliginosibacterium sp. 31-16]MDP5240788.1 ATP-binding protein [Uliginosibacterium sp. 31-16]
MNQTPPPMDAASLAEAFQAFARASDELTQAYNGLQGQVGELTERLTLLMAALPAGVVLLDGTGAVEQLNRAAIRMLGAVPATTPWSVLLARFEHTDTPGEYFLPQDGDAALRVSISETPLDTRGGRIVLLHDVTEAWQMRTQTTRTERLAAMGEMVASLAHQLRTPLAAALLYTGHMATTDLDPLARARVSERALERLRHLEKLIQDMLIFARGEALGRESFGVCDLVAELAHTIEPVAQRRGVAFSADCAAGARQLFGNRKEIAGALINLLENALQAVGEGGTVAFTACEDGANAMFAVQDNGRGIPQELQARLFEPFYTTRADGTGLGLAIARGVARAHGGEINLKSAPGEGTEFSLVIPLAAVADSDKSGANP